MSSRNTTRTTGNLKRKYSFKRGERLAGNKAVSDLFQSGLTIHAYPLRILYKTTSGSSYPARVAVGVPKRTFKNAVERNLLKRRIREAYRLGKSELYDRLVKNGVQLHLMILYQHDRVESFASIQKGLQQGLEILVKSADNGAPSQAHR